MLEAWQQRWHEITRKSRRGDLAACRGQNLTNYKVYKDLYKHQAFVLMQVRIGCVGMADFLLFYRYVPDMPTLLYSCGTASKTPEHVLLYCTEIAEKKKIMRQRVASIALRIRQNLAQLILKYPELISRMASANRKIRLI
jgi:hypothetical protein